MIYLQNTFKTMKVAAHSYHHKKKEQVKRIKMGIDNKRNINRGKKELLFFQVKKK